MPRIAITSADLFPGDTGSVLPDHTLLIEDGRIAAVLPPGAPLPGGDVEVVDLPGTTVLPGLIDLHVHLADWVTTPRLSAAGMGFAAAQRVVSALHNGTTTLRDVGGPSGFATSVRDAVASGVGPGSRVFAANEMVCMTGGHGSEPPLTGMGREADGPDECRKAVREQLKAGADLIKVTTNGPLDVVELTQVELDAIVDEAHRCGLRVACHASILEATRMAVRAGVDTIEHGCDLDEETAAAMAERGIVLVPTLVAMQRIMADWERYRDIPSMRAVPVRARRHVESFRLALAAGVRIGAGTDTSPTLGGFAALPDELAAMVGAGMTPAQALTAATSVGADALGRAGELGVLAPGALADLLVCAGSPHRDIADLRRVRLVVKDGVVVHDVRAGRPSRGVDGPADAVADREVPHELVGVRELGAHEVAGRGRVAAPDRAKE